MERAVVIANPVASQFTGGSHRDVMSEISKSHDVEALWPSSAHEATENAAAAAADGVGVVVAMGGDGMVHHVAQGLVGTDATLGIVPAGTTNVVARLFGVPSRQSRAARLIGRGPRPVSVGTAKMTLTRGETVTEHHAVFACGFGLDAEVVRVADSDPYRKYRFGSIHYARSALGVGLKDYPSVKPHVRFTAGVHEMLATTALVQFREVYTYFGKISLRFGDDAPEPMSVLVLDRLKRRRIPNIFFSALTHRDLDQIEGFEVWRDVKRLDLSADPDVAVQADGENLGSVDGGTVEWEPDSLKVIVGPKSSSG
ncbi:MAG TPA: diacylglycerol kinase family protein [Acidimicrobiia bacterium]|nr:diacylglycerol kinase family protein [Acidimicrobiia bacterium]